MEHPLADSQKPHLSDASCTPNAPNSSRAGASSAPGPKPPWHHNKLIDYPFNKQRKINGRELRADNHRHDERLVVELINAPLSVHIPRVDMVLLYHKDISAMELCRVKSFHGALITTWGIKINTYRDKNSSFIYAKLYIPYDVLLKFSDFQFENEEQYTAVQRAYAIEKILHMTVIMSKFETDLSYKRYDYRRMVDDGICIASYVPHDTKANDHLLHSWAMLKNIFNAQPIEKIKDYFGGSIAIHFAWCGYFNVALLLGCFFGVFGYIGSLIVSHGQYDYPIEEVCAGVYDYYPRCPLCDKCDFTVLSDSCKARRDLRNKSNILFCILMSFWIGTLLTSFTEYLNKLTHFWESSYTRQDVDIYHLSVVKQAKRKRRGNIEPIRISYLKKYPQLLAMYDLEVKPSFDFAEQCNVSFHQITLESLNASNALNLSNVSEASNTSSASNGQENSAQSIENQRKNENDNQINVSFTPDQFHDYKNKRTEPDELGFVMTTNEPLSNKKFEPADEEIRYIAHQQDETLYQLYGWEAVKHCLVAWSMTLIFLIYFILIFLLYVRLLGHIKSSEYYLPFANALLNQVTRILHRRVVYYLTKWQVPKYQSQFDKWLSVKLILCYLTEYVYFFYTAVFAEFYYTIPIRIKDPPMKTKPCLEDDCHYSLSLSFARILTVDQFLGLFSALIWPGYPSGIFGISCCNKFQIVTRSTMILNKYIKMSIRRFKLFLWGARETTPKRKTSFSMVTQPGTWLTDYTLFDYWTQPFLLETYMKIIPLLGYAALFAANWFWSPFILYIFSTLYMRIQAYHLLKHYRRPVPERAKKLGFWERFIGYMVLASFVVNGFIFSFLSDVVPQTLNLANNGTLQGYITSTVSFYNVKNISDIFGLSTHARDYCIYNGNLEPPWSESPLTLSTAGCARLFYKLLFFVIYAAVFHFFCRWMRYDLASLFENLFQMTVSVCHPLLKKMTTYLTPETPLEKNEDTTDQPFSEQSEETNPFNRHGINEEEVSGSNAVEMGTLDRSNDLSGSEASSNETSNL